MIMPIRCLSCGKPLAHLWEKYNEMKSKEDAGKTLDRLGVERYCCRSLFLTHADLLKDVTKFKR